MRYPTHPKGISLTNIKLQFFPPNVTNKIQPLDRDVIKVLKLSNCLKLVQRYLRETTDEKILKINVLYVIHYISIAWGEIKPEVIKNCFNKAHFGHVSYEVLYVLNSNEWQDFEEAYPGYTSFDDQLMTNETLDLNDIIIQTTVNGGSDDPKDVEEEYTTPLPSLASTKQSITLLRQALSATKGSENMLL